MIWFIVGIVLIVVVNIMIVALFASTKGEDKLTETSYQHHHAR